jgi:hypothetical protein
MEKEADSDDRTNQRWLKWKCVYLAVVDFANKQKLGRSLNDLESFIFNAQTSSWSGFGQACDFGIFYN